jgi:D-alanyl-D-alanine carboxypeptidase/D-alanyl-D-alanine-endopeptidase (penicillin-binding protein 4)
MRGTLLWVLGAIAGTAQAQLPAPIQRILDGHEIPAHDVSIVVQAVAAKRPLLSHEPDASRNPASTIKLLTTWVALDALGPTYTWPTEVYFLGNYSGDALDGDLGIKGYGDPYLVTEEFWKLLRALRRTGLTEVGGDLVVDDSYFAPIDEDPGEFDGQPYRTYNVTPNALLLNYQAARFQFLPDADRRGVRISVDPEPSNLSIGNRLALIDGPCRGYQAGISFNVVDAPTNRQIVFEGQFPAACAPYGLTRSVLQHDSFVYGVYRSLWAELGGRHRGGMRREAIAAAGTEPALTWRSRPLAEIIRSVNKFSNNVMTRQLLLTLAAERAEAPARAEDGVAAIGDYLAGKSLDTTDLVLVNGAGLSRDTRISARLLADTLLLAARSPLAPEFLASLSLGGLDGTTRRRFGGLPAVGRMHVKTGRLNDVSALAGLVHAADGADFVIVVILNSTDAHRGPGEELQDALIRWVYEQV